MRNARLFPMGIIVLKLGNEEKMEFNQAKRLDDLHVSGTRIVFSKCAELAKAGIPVTALTLGQPDYDTPDYIIEACKKSLDAGQTRYTDGSGIQELKEAICKKLKVENDLNYKPEEISVTTGVAQGMFVAIMACLNEGDEILVPDPVYLTYSEIPAVAGAVIKKYDLLEENDYQIDLEQLKSNITEKTRMLVIVSPSNPTGGVLDRESLEAIADLAKEHNFLILSDEIYDRFVYDEKELISIASLPGMKERTIVLNGFSKSMAMTGWRLGYIAAPEEMIEPMNRLSFYMTAGTTTFVQYAGVSALLEEDGSIDRMRDEFEKRRDYLVEEINKLEHFSCKNPEGAFYIFMNIRKTGMTAEEFCNYAIDEYRLAMIPGSAFGEKGEGYVRLSYASSMEVLREGIEKLKKIDKDIEREK